ncbi:hypothetical protein NE865_03836 [Phthorimaea operculella]|nr:hypothetical protein NE865_03836 [Phthorimaea operculella]
MGRKRKRARSRSSDYDKLRKKVKRLQESLRHHRRHSFSSSSDEDYRSDYSSYDRRYYEDCYPDYQDIPDNEDPEAMALDEDPILTQKSTTDVVPSSENKDQQEPASSKQESSPQEILDPEILQILGEDPSDQKSYGENLHKDIATRWAHILTNGLSKENKADLLKQYLPSENCINMKAPILNLEIKAALTELNVKKDLFSQSKQNQISSCLSAIAKVLNWALSSKDSQAQEIIKPLSDAGRLLCDSHYRESQSRRRTSEIFEGYTKDWLRNEKRCPATPIQTASDNTK